MREFGVWFGHFQCYSLSTFFLIDIDIDLDLDCKHVEKRLEAGIDPQLVFAISSAQNLLVGHTESLIESN